MFLQTDRDVTKEVCSEKCPLSPQDAIQLMSVKVEEVSNVQEEKFPVPVTWQEMKTELEVSSLSVWPLLSRWNRYLEMPPVFLISLCMSICPSVCPLETNPLC
jgi:hypothetical protein